MQKLRTVVVGMGARGKIHLHGILQNPEIFEIVGICDQKKQCLERAAAQYVLPDEICWEDAEEMLRCLRPDVMAFATMPNVRLSLAELAAKYGVKGLMFEKPMATSLTEAEKIKNLCQANGIKTVVCQQHKYLRSFQRLKEVLDTGEIGEVYRIEASCQPQASQLGTHYIDYILWAAGGARAVSVTGHVHGSFYLEDGHPSPDYVSGGLILENGIRAVLECGYFAEQHAEHDVGFTHGPGTDAYWTDDRLTVYGTRGYAWASCSGAYAVFSPLTSPEIRMGDYGDFFEREQYEAQVHYTKDFGRWMLGQAEGHPCNIAQAYHGYEILEAIYISAIERTRVDLPLELPMPYEPLDILKKELKPVEYRKWKRMEELQ